MKGLIWKIRFVLEMARIIGKYWPIDLKFYWDTAGAHAENINFEYDEETPADCVSEEISCWYN
jgi:hypothetical protein